MQTEGWTSSGRLAILSHFHRYYTLRPGDRLMRVYQSLSKSTCRSPIRFQGRPFARAIFNAQFHATCFSLSVKAGGMRITQHKTPKDERETKPSKDVEESRPSSR